MNIAHLAIGGLTQDTDRVTGTIRLWLERLRPLEREGCFTAWYPWCQDWGYVAGLLSALGIKRVSVASYSYGAGIGWPRLCRALEGHGINVPYSTLSDPVPRWWHTAMHLHRHAIAKPVNASYVHVFRQERDWIRGHQVVGMAKESIIKAHFHDGMDDADEFHIAAEWNAKLLTKEAA